MVFGVEIVAVDVALFTVVSIYIPSRVGHSTDAASFRHQGFGGSPRFSGRKGVAVTKQLLAPQNSQFDSCIDSCT